MARYFRLTNCHSTRPNQSSTVLINNVSLEANFKGFEVLGGRADQMDKRSLEGSFKSTGGWGGGKRSLLSGTETAEPNRPDHHIRILVVGTIPVNSGSSRDVGVYM